MTGPSPDALARIQLEAARQEAREHQRRLMQGLGKPIISFENHGYRVVCVGKEVRWKTWRTFPDFLFDYIKVKLTSEWGNTELAKPEVERHRSSNGITRSACCSRPCPRDRMASIRPR
ncbi:hypothetical protein JJE66_35395 [Bradyrhizobium diazoefficiens]|uniref:hypothetical protein n=1 Tax=Bradyrhizobium diazoefficiens TaxID=1355477 RepID=UPI00190B6745|nr:hypothetical protein [Bradyrhizobium diazoefficiens]MBK3666485.1 hypothetical protein [Bradyrhizobium diazoefficiens]